jgi:hypothetical protein
MLSEPFIFCPIILLMTKFNFLKEEIRFFFMFDVGNILHKIFCYIMVQLSIRALITVILLMVDILISQFYHGKYSKVS